MLLIYAISLGGQYKFHYVSTCGKHYFTIQIGRQKVKEDSDPRHGWDIA